MKQKEILKKMLLFFSVEEKLSAFYNSFQQEGR